jgi:hypothetical protein
MNEIDRLITDGNILDRLEALERQVRLLLSKSSSVQDLSQLSGDLGEMAVGNVINLFSTAIMSKTLIIDGETLRVPTDYVYLVPRRLQVDGNLEIDGEVMVL